MSDLYPCPFCKAVPEPTQIEIYADKYRRVKCRCGAVGPQKRSVEEAIEAWNTRPGEDAALDRAVTAVKEASPDTYDNRAIAAIEGEKNG